MKVLLSHPTGNSFVRAAAMGLLNADMLGGFETTVATFPGNIFDRLGSTRPFAEFKRRQYDQLLQPHTKAFPWYELGRFAASRAGLKTLTGHESGIFSIDSVYRTLDKRTAKTLAAGKDKFDAIYAYEDGANFSFKEAKRLEIQCFYDLPIGYWRTAARLLEIERQRWPDWTSTLTALSDSDEKLARKDEELRLADRIFVASSFTASTLKDFPGKLAPVEVIPYGFPPVFKSRNYPSPQGRPIKVLFVGRLSQRKGIADLFAATDAIGKHIELTVIGLKINNDCPALDDALGRHKWIPSLPHGEILKIMRENDILIFPSLFEGFGLVITEAMSQGTPVITTERTAGPDLINHGENGWLIKSGSVDTLRSAIEDILINPSSIALVGKAAAESADKRPWSVYGEELVTAISK